MTWTLPMRSMCRTSSLENRPLMADRRSPGWMRHLPVSTGLGPFLCASSASTYCRSSSVIAARRHLLQCSTVLQHSLATDSRAGTHSWVIGRGCFSSRRTWRSVTACSAASQMTYTSEAGFAVGPQAVAVTPAPAQVQAPQPPAQAAPVPTAAQSPPPRQHPGFQPPANEAERLEALHSLQILDTEPEARFDDITRIVKAVFKVQFAAITLVDKDRLW